MVSYDWSAALADDVANLKRGFKALKQMTKMNYLHRHRPEEALKTYRELLSYTKVCHLSLNLTDFQSDVTRNYAEKSINNILDYVGGEGKVCSPFPFSDPSTLDPWDVHCKGFQLILHR